MRMVSRTSAEGMHKMESSGFGEAVRRIVNLEKELRRVESLIVRPLSSFSSVYKTADETVTSSTVLQNDNHLLFPVSANIRYAFDLTLTVFSNVGDIKFAWDYPVGLTMDWSVFNSINPSRNIQTDTIAVTTLTDNDTSLVIIRGNIIVGANAGTLTLKWAQNTSSVNGTIIKDGSNMSYWNLN